VWSRQGDLEPDPRIAAGNTQATLQSAFYEKLFGNRRDGGHGAMRENPIEQGAEIGHRGAANRHDHGRGGDGFVITQRSLEVGDQGQVAAGDTNRRVVTSNN
jgi:hypothetical protein